MEVIFIFNIGTFIFDIYRSTFAGDEPCHFAEQLLLFILAERALMALKWALENVLGSKTVVQLHAEEHNEKAGPSMSDMARKWLGHSGFGWLFDDFGGVRPLCGLPKGRRERHRCWTRSCRHSQRIASRAEG